MEMDFLNPALLARIPKEAKHILDLGCGDGRIGKKIKELQECSVVGVNISESEAQAASKSLDKVIIGDLNNFDISNLGKFDCIICSHILEHLYQPQQSLMHLHRDFNPDGILVVGLPNILFWRCRFSFLAGNFKYIRGTATDPTHMHFFDRKSSRQLIEGAGYEVLSQQADGNFPLPFIRRFIPILAEKIDRFALNHWPGMFGVQFIITARSRIDKSCVNINTLLSGDNS